MICDLHSPDTFDTCLGERASANVQPCKSLVRQLVNTTANGDVKTLTYLQFMLGFTDHQISQVAENLGMIFTLSDVYQFIEIWDKRHAVKILSVINDVFRDVKEDNQSRCLSSDESDDDYVFDDELLDEGNDELFDMIVDNLLLSQLHSSMFEEEHISDGSIEAGVPSATLEFRMNFSD